jgi:hypothetical protein
MDSSGLTVPVAVLRDAVQARVAVTSLRAVEAETGVSYTALRNFLSGGEPYSGNRKKLTTWYLASGADPEPSDALAALGMLLSGLPPSRRMDALLDLLSRIEEKYIAEGLPPPAWLVNARSLANESK